MQKALIIIGVVLIAVGLFWPLLSQLPFGRLPGDIAIERGNSRFYFPIMTCILVSVLLTIVVRFFSGR